MIAIIFFTQIWPSYYIVMMIAGADDFARGAVRLWATCETAARAERGRSAGRRSRAGFHAALGLFKAFAPLLLGVVIVDADESAAAFRNGSNTLHLAYRRGVTAASRSIFLLRRASLFL